MQLFLFLMTASVSLMFIVENDGIQLMSLLNGSFLEGDNQSTRSSPSKPKLGWVSNSSAKYYKRQRWKSHGMMNTKEFSSDFEYYENEKERIARLWDPILNQSYDFPDVIAEHDQSCNEYVFSENPQHKGTNESFTKNIAEPEPSKDGTIPNLLKGDLHLPETVPPPAENIRLRKHRLVRQDKAGYSPMIQIFFDRRPIYGEKYPVIVAMKSLGTVPFVLNITVDTKDYLIDDKITRPTSPKEWISTRNLRSVLRRAGIHEAYVAFNLGYYYRCHATFYNKMHKYAIASVSDLEDREVLLTPRFRKSFRVVVPKNIARLPVLLLPFCKDPEVPVPVSAWTHRVFYAIILKRSGKVKYKEFSWDFYDMKEEFLIAHAGTTKDRVFLLRASGVINNVFTVARCYVKYIPPDIETEISGGQRRNVDVRDYILVDGSGSKDRVLAVESLKTKNFQWNCESTDDPENRYCKYDLSTKPKLRFPKRSLRVGKKYSIGLTVYSKIDPRHRSSALQILRGVEKDTIAPNIVCRRNCALDVYSPVDSVHLTSHCPDCRLRVRYYEWLISEEGGPITSVSRKRFLVWRGSCPYLDIYLKMIMVNNVQGISRYSIYRNDGPQGGECKASPDRGIEATTLFSITCVGYESPFVPLNFRFKIGVAAVATMVPFTKIKIVLPVTNVLEISICDTVDMCVWQKLPMIVAPYMVKNPQESYENHIKEVMASVPEHLLLGHWNKAFTLTLAATKWIISPEDGMMIFSYLKNQDLQTGGQLEQITLLGIRILSHLLPLTFRAANLMGEIFIKLTTIFEHTVHEKGWLHRDAYNSLTAMFMAFMSILGDKDKVEAHSMAMCKPTSPECINMVLLENLELQLEMKFDPLILLKVNYWMRCTWFLYRCTFYMGMLATKRHHPYDEAFAVLEGGIAYQVNVTEVTEETENVTINTIDMIHVVQLSGPLLFELSKKLNHTTILFQVISQQNFHNIFWWFPDPLPSKTSVLIIHAHSPSIVNYTSGIFSINNRLLFTTNISEFNDDPVFNQWMANGTIKRSSEIHLYSLMLKNKAMLAVRIVSCSEPMKVKMRLHRQPSAVEMKDACYITPQMSGKRIWMSNNCPRSLAFVAVQRTEGGRLVRKDYHHEMLREDSGQDTPLNYSILLEIYQCNVWQNRTLDPGWDAENCITSFKHSYGTSVQCSCSILGALASRIVPIAAERHIDYFRSEILTFKILLPLFFLLLLLLLLILMILSFGSLSAHERRENFLRCEGSKEGLGRLFTDENEILLVVVTGGREFAGTTSNVKFYFKSPHRPQTSYVVTQDCAHPKLLTNSTNKLLVPRGSIFIPTRLALGVQRNGRFPSWYCRTVTVVDLKLKAQQLFVVERWIHSGHTEFMRSRYFTFGTQKRDYQYTWATRFRNRLEQLFISWFMANPITGPWQSSVGNVTMNRFERSCAWISKLAISLTAATMYLSLKRTKAMEQSNGLQQKDQIHMDQVVLLAVVIFFLCCVVQVFFQLLITRVFFLE
ncbi:uncharacterized protein Dana_GF15006 [Drosophila ananassae]|uniref:PLAT domain-containing protein n=1 Tax=Drosophila ananassae TaxID=7217 RepID=B3MLE9_DROAN|nr:uncharacterized protein Dana_GF15006 [Drosophila ananassae]